MKIEGTVEDIIYRNEENGYTVMVIDHEGDPVTAVGYFPMLSEGEYLCLEGEYRYNSKYGMQFEVKNISSVSPQSKEGITRFLASGLIHGVGEVIASRIVDMFGLKTFDVIENNPEELAKVKGISLEKAQNSAILFRRAINARERYVFARVWSVALAIP